MSRHKQNNKKTIGRIKSEEIKPTEFKHIQDILPLGHLRFAPGSLGQRRPDDEEGGSGGNGLLSHPLISQSQYFSGMPENISANTMENTDTEHNADQLELQQKPTLAAKNENTNTNRSTPSIPTPRR